MLKLLHYTVWMAAHGHEARRRLPGRVQGLQAEQLQRERISQMNEPVDREGADLASSIGGVPGAGRVGHACEKCTGTEGADDCQAEWKELQAGQL